MLFTFWAQPRFCVRGKNKWDRASPITKLKNLTQVWMSALSELKKSEPADKLVNWQTSNCGFYANMTSQKLLKSTQTPVLSKCLCWVKNYWPQVSQCDSYINQKHWTILLFPIFVLPEPPVCWENVKILRVKIQKYHRLAEVPLL